MVFPKIQRSEWERVPLPAPEQLGPGEVLVRTACALVNSGTEVAIYSGTHIGYTLAGSNYPRLPYRPGWAFAGTVTAVGSEAATLRPGDRVGGSARIVDWTVARADRLALLPERVSFEQGCLALQSVVGLQGIRVADVRLGEAVVVFGQGLIGQFARQWAALSGAVTTIAVDLLDARLEVARRHGATHLVNAARDGVVGAIASTTNGRGVDVAIEATGHPPVINDALRAAAPLGRVVLLGSPRGRVEIDPYSDIHRKGVKVIGAHSTTAASTPNAYHRWTEAEHYRLAIEMIRQGRLHTEGLITHRVPADEALGIFDALTERPQEQLGVIIRWE